jgi:hypothetical protein
MTIRQQNFKKHPHTARFLMKFHAAAAGLPADIEPEAVQEEKAIAFLTGAPSRPVAKQEIFVKGWRITTGPGLITQKQADWIVDIAETREGVTDEMVRSLAERLIQGFNRQAASDFIARYKDLPRKSADAARTEAIAPGADTTARPSTEPSDVPAGRYAIVEEGVTKFYRVSKGKNQWAGRTFVNAQASDEQYPVRNPVKVVMILAAISEDLAGAATRYGLELGRCYRCGRTLTDETSRALGIGPECRKK